MAFYNEKEQLYLEADVLGVRLGGCLLQARDRMQFLMDETTDSAVLLKIAFTSKSLRSAENHYNNVERSTIHTAWPRKVSPLLLHP